MDSILHHLENTNNAPTTQQQAWLESERLLLRSKKIVLEQEMAEFRLQFAAIERQCNQYTRVLSPIRRFPNEILLEIFNKLSSSDHRSVLSVSQVCHGWREVIHDIHSLWTEVTIPLPGHRNQPKDVYQFLQQVEHYALYAGGTPISLTIGNISESIVDSLLYEIFEEDSDGLSVPVCWSHMSIYTTKLLNFSRLALGHYEALGRDTTDLTSLAITASIFDDIYAGLEDVLDLTQFPELRSFRFDIRNPSSLDNRVLINWNILTFLTLRSRKSCVEYLEIISRCPALETLDITPDVIEEDLVQGPLVTLAKLRKLIITTEYQPITIIERLLCPALEDVAFTFGGFTGINDLSITHFLERLSAGRLHRLQCSGDALFAFLEKRDKIPSLLSLKVTAPFGEVEGGLSSIFNELTQAYDDEHRFFNLLEEMEFQDYPPFSPGGMMSCATMIESHIMGSETHPEAKNPRLRFVFTYTERPQLNEPTNLIHILTRYQEMGILSGLF
ncbi:hypothetical protein CPB83DRAFT_843654 [Crepidotus variabilis]|uniref:F-box domain-containing protein n=1 Tax=Crepidotus variabilis TaxID=179855 RepID=A0A9P6JW47_9AGAR|nr:hypothetical protein CPB83DRAFT_843654 [Crepidotus variabilis]